MHLVFGPIPSRRFGKSLGINNIPDKHCTYSCVYCQLGQTKTVPAIQKEFYLPQEIIKQVTTKLRELQVLQELPDVITFVPDGEPTLDLHLKELVLNLKQWGIPLVIISNSSLVPQTSVQEVLKLFDIVSLKLDAITESTWKRLNRPHHDLKLPEILQAIKSFAKSYTGTLLTETMLVHGYQTETELQGLARFLATIPSLKTAFLSIPTRPPALPTITPPREDIIHLAYQIFRNALGEERVRLLNMYEGNDFVQGQNIIQDLLSILSVHPMRKQAVYQFLAQKTTNPKQLIHELLAQGKIISLIYQNQEYFMLKLKGRNH